MMSLRQFIATLIGSVVALFSFREKEVRSVPVQEKCDSFEKTTRLMADLMKREDWRLSRPITDDEAMMMARYAICSPDPKLAIRSCMKSLGIKDKTI